MKNTMRSRFGEDVVHCGLPTPPATLKEARRLLVELGDAVAVADILGVSAQTVRLWNVKHGWGVKMRRGGNQRLRRAKSPRWRCCGVLYLEAGACVKCGVTPMWAQKAS